MKKITFFVLIILIANFLHAQDLQGVKIYVNPGHGGFNSNDRNVVVPPFAQGDTMGFWESKSNLAKGLHLRDLLKAEGATVYMSRTKNRTEDDRKLSAIAEEANANSVDYMISIHSNAHNTISNYPLMLFHGYDNKPILQPSLDVAELIWENLYSNQTAQWTTSHKTVKGDKSFAPASWNGYGVLRPLTVPGLISEGSFHDYTPETYRLLNDDYKKLEAWHQYRSFKAYYGAKPDSLGKIAGFVKDAYKKVSNYYFTPNSKDQWLPVNGATVTLNPGNKTYKVDSLNNGFYMFDNLHPGKYTLTISQTKYVEKIEENIEVKADSVSYFLCYLSLDRSDSLQVLDYAPKLDIEENAVSSSKIWFQFNFEVDRNSFENGFSIQPNIKGKITYEEQDRIAVFTPNQPLDISTKYVVTLDKSVKHIGNLPLKKDFVFSFTSANRNRLSILDIYPKNKMDSVYPNTQLKIHFDGKLNSDNIRSLINIYDAEGSEISKRSIKVNNDVDSVGVFSCLLKNLKIDSTYTVKLDSAISDVDNVLLYEDKTLTFKVSPVYKSTANVAYDFEQSTSADQWRIDNTLSSNIETGTANRILRYSSSKLFGSYSYRLFYDFSRKSASVATLSDKKIAINNKDYIGLYIWGNLSHNKLSLIAKKNENYIYLPLATIDFAGWQFKSVVVNLPDDISSAEIVGVKLESVGTPFSQKGVLYFDNMLISKNPLTTVKNNRINQNELILYPNPTHDYINIILPSNNKKCHILIYNTDGKLLEQKNAENTGKTLKISTLKLKKGNYILQIRDNISYKSAIFTVY